MHKCKLGSLLLFVLFIFTSLSAEPYTWNNVYVGGGGFVTGVIYHPAEAGLAYAKTDMGGAYRRDATDERWIPITDFLTRNNADYMGILGLALDPSDPDKVYLLTGKYTQSWAGNGALLASSDRGDTWTINPLNFKVGGNEVGRGAGERLAVDPNLGSILFAGTNGDVAPTGLWKSTNSGTSFIQVTSFPQTQVNFIIFDPATGTTGNPTQTIYVSAGVNDSSLYKSTNGGNTWSLIANQPTGLQAFRGVLVGTRLYLTYASNNGPNNSNATGGVYYMNTTNDSFTNISPPTGGYGFAGISVDAQNTNNILVSTLFKWSPMDSVYYSTNGGSSWTDVNATAVWNAVKAPHALESNPHWVTDVQIDPFDSGEAWFNTGYGLWQTENLDNMIGTVTWDFESEDLEETVAMDIVSPPSGGNLISAMGDIDGFVHDTLDASPAGRFSPQVGTTLSIDFAQDVPSKLVKGFNASPYGGYSTDGGYNWTNFASAPSGTSAGGSKAIAISANGNNIVWSPTGSSVSYSTNNGSSWTASSGGVPLSNPVSDRVNSNKFYVYDGVAGNLWYSTNGGASFTQGASGIPGVDSWAPADGMVATPFGEEGHVWITAGNNGLYRSTDSGQSASKVNSVDQAYRIGFGMAAPAGTYPAIFLFGTVSGQLGFWRSDDEGSTWNRINTDANQYGYVHSIIGDPRIYGRVYISAEGRGMQYGDFAGTPTDTPTVDPASTDTYTPTVTPTPTDTPEPPPFDIVYDGDTAGHTFATGSTDADAGATYNETAAGVTGNGWEVAYTSPGWWQQMYWDLGAGAIAIGANTEIVFEVKQSDTSPGAVSQLLVNVNWSTTALDVATYLEAGGAVTTSWKTVRIPLSDFDPVTQIQAIAFINNWNSDYSIVVDNIRLEGAVPPTDTETPNPLWTDTYTATPTETVDMSQIPGFYVNGRFLYSPCGEKVIPYGVNAMSVWHWADRDGSVYMNEIAQTGANIVRIVWTMADAAGSYTNATPADLDAVIQSCIDNNMIPMIENHFATGDIGLVDEVVNWWTKPEILAVIQKHEKYLLINIANEAGNTVTDTEFRTVYTSAITTMRSAGIRVPLIIDATGWGQNINILQANGPYLITQDPLQNLMFSVHMWWPNEWGHSAAEIQTEIAESVAMGLPLIVGEFAQAGTNSGACFGTIEWQTIMQECVNNEIGYLPWSWGIAQNSDCISMGMTCMGEFDTLGDQQPCDYGSGAVPIGDNSYAYTVVNDPNYGIAANSVIPQYILNGFTCGGDTATPTQTYTYTSTVTFTDTNTDTFTPTPTETDTLAVDTETFTETETNTQTFTETPTDTNTETPVDTDTETFTETPTDTDTVTETFSETDTETITETPTETETFTVTPTFTAGPCACSYNVGKEVMGASQWAIGDYIEANAMYVSEISTLKSISAYVASTSGGSVVFSVYESSGGAPTNLIVSSVEQASIAGWNTLQTPDTVLTPGAYWVAIQAAPGVQFAYDEGIAYGHVYSAQAYGTIPSVYPVGNYYNYEYSVYMELCPLSCVPTETPTPVGVCMCIDEMGLKYIPAAVPGNVAGYIASNAYMSPVDGVAQSADVYVAATTGGAVRLGIYSDDNSSGSNKPSALLAQTDSFVVSTGWNNIPLRSEIMLTGGGIYWISIQMEAGVDVARDPGSTGDEKYSTYAYGDFMPYYNWPEGDSNSLWAMNVNICPVVCPDTPTETETFTETETLVDTATETFTETETTTITETPPPGSTDTYTPTETQTAMDTQTETFTQTETETPVPTESETPTITDTVPPGSTDTYTPTETNTAQNTQTYTYTFTATYTQTFTQTYTMTATSTPTLSINITLASPSTINVGIDTDLYVYFDNNRAVTSIDAQLQDIFGTPLQTVTLPASAFAAGSNSIIIPLDDAVNGFDLAAVASDSYRLVLVATNGVDTAASPMSLLTINGAPTVTETETLPAANTSTETPTFTYTHTFTETPVLTNTETQTPNPSVTPTPTQGDTLEITELLPYPNPFNPTIAGAELRFTFQISQTDIDSISIRMYTAGYRLIKEVVFAESAMMQVINRKYIRYAAEDLATLANGTYYYLIIAEKGGEAVRSKVDKVIILK